MVIYYNKNNVPFLLYIPIINYRLLLFILCEDIKFHTIQRFYLFFLITQIIQIICLFSKVLSTNFWLHYSALKYIIKGTHFLSILTTA